MSFATDLESLLSHSTPPIAALARELFETVQSIRPDFSPKISMAWMTVNFHRKPGGFIAALYVRGERVYLVFQDGRLLDSPLLTDDGKVKRVRWIPFVPGDEIPVDDIAILLVEAVALRS